MIIANPIYDTVFNYLLDDNKVAKLLIGAILGVEIIDLEFKPQEIPVVLTKSETISVEKSQFIQVLRMDFKARIQYPDGSSKLVLIELQKAKTDTDLMRFRRYLGTQYTDSKNTFQSNNKEKPLPIITIYFLGYTLKNFEHIPVLRIKRQYVDNYTKEVILQEDEFVEALSHDAVVIQIPIIKHKKRYELEQILSIFEDGNVMVFDMRHPIPPHYEPILKRLHAALSDEEVRNARIAQEEFLYEFESHKKAIEEMRKQKEELEVQNEEQRKQKEEERKQKEEERKQKEEERKQKEEERKQKEEALAREAVLRNREKMAIKELKGKGMSNSEIARLFHLSEEEVVKILQ